MKKLFNRRQVEDVIANEMAKHKVPAYAVANLNAFTHMVEVDGSKHVVTTVTAGKDTVDWNRSSYSAIIHPVAKVRQGNVLKPVKRFSYSEMHLTINAALNCKPESWLFNATFAYDTVDGHWYLRARKEDGADFFAALDGDMTEITVEEWDKVTKKALVYNDCSTITGASASAGNLKKHKLVCPCMNEQGVAHLERSLQTTGGISLLYTDPSRLDTAKAIAQANVRESAPYTASFNGPRIRAAAFHMGKWDIPDVVTGKRFQGADGNFITNGNLYSRWMEELGYEVMTDAAVTGIVSQQRPFSIKGVSFSMPGWGMVDMIANPDCVCHAAEVVVLYASQIGRKEQKAFRQAFDSKGKKGAFAGKTVIVVYDDSIVIDADDPASFEQVDVLGDMNAEKAEQDMKQESFLNILKLFRKSKKDWKNGMGTSTQFLQSLMPVCPCLKDIMQTGFGAQMAKAVEDIKMSEARKLTTQDILSNIKKPSVEAVDDLLAASENGVLTDREKSIILANDYGMNVVNLAELVAPTYCWEKDAALFKDELKAATLAGKSRADRVRNPIDGTDFVLVPDLAAFYGEPLLTVKDGKYQGYSTLVNKIGAKHAAGIKYPKQHIGEMALFDFMDEERVAYALDNHKYASKVAFLYACASEAALFAPATSDFQDQEAGLDFDGDEIFCAEVLAEDEYKQRVAEIDWSEGWRAMEEFVKVTIAYYLSLIKMLVVSIDADAEDKYAKKNSVDDKLNSGAAIPVKIPATVDLDKLWDGVNLGENMPTRQEVEARGIVNPGNEASVRNIENANLEVGIVTVIHLVFSHLFFELEAMKGKKDEELNEKELQTVDVSRKIMKIVFENKEVVGNKYDSLVYGVNAAGIAKVKMDINEYHRIRESARTMELTRANMAAFFYDLVANGRMAQEMTIDACKTLLRVANLDYAANLRACVKLLSRDKMDINLDYKAVGQSSISVVMPEHGDKTNIKTTFERVNGKRVEKTQIAVRDWAFDLKLEGYEAVTKAIEPLLSNRPGFDGELIERLVSLAKSNPDVAKFASSMDVKYKHLNTAQERTAREVIDNANTKDPKEIALLRSEVKRDHAAFFNAIGDTLRKGLENFGRTLRMKGLTEDEAAAMKAALIISLAYTSKQGNADSRLSSFAYRALPEEYMRFILDYVCKDDDRVTQYTSDELKWVDPALCHVGDSFLFKDGEGMLGDICVAKAKDALNGKYTIMRDEDDANKLVASARVLDLMPLQKNNNTLVVETKLSDWMSSHMETFLREIAPDDNGNAARIQLWGKKTQGQNGDELHDVLAVEDEFGAYGVGYFDCGTDNSAFGVYNGISGEVTNVTIYQAEGSDDKIAILLLENCKPADENQYVDPVNENLPVDKTWKPAAKPVIKAKKFKSIKESEKETKAEGTVKPVKPAKFAAAKVKAESKAKFTAVAIKAPDMDMFDNWDYGVAD